MKSFLKYTNSILFTIFTLILFTNNLSAVEPEDETIPTTDPEPEAATCDSFADMFQTRGICSGSSGGSVTFTNAGQISDGSTNVIIENNDKEMNTCEVTAPDWVQNQFETCGESGDCEATGTAAESLTINYANAPATANVSASPTSSTTDIVLNGTTTLSEYTYNTVTTSSNTNTSTTFEVTNQLKINNLKMTTGNTFAFSSANPYSLEIGTLGIENNGVGNTIITDANAKNIKINTFDLPASTTLALTAEQTLQMENFTVGRGSNVILKAQYVNINNFTSSNSGSGDSEITIYADYIDIGDLTLNQTVTLNILPYTAGKRILFRTNTLEESSSSSIIISSGNYYVNTALTIPGTSDISALRAVDGNQIINLYINSDLTLGNNPGINATGNNGNYDSSFPAANFMMFINGNLTTGGGGTTINATIYLEGDATFGNPTYIKGAISAQNITIGQGQFTYDQSLDSAGFGQCGITIGFDKDEYQTKEDYTLFDNFTSILEIEIILSSAVNSDTSVTYTTRDGTAIAGTTNDYLSTTGTATILAGEISTTIDIDIVHDIDIELDEYFYVDLSNIQSTDPSISMGINPVKVTILAQTASDLPLCYTDDFSNDLDNEWRTLRGVNYDPKAVDGRLRLTDGSGSIATAVTKDYEFASQHNMIVVEFEHYAYGGCMDSGSVGSGLGAYGADGIVAVLYDSDIGSEPEPGAVGGSMGYAQNTSRGGFEGGWLGLGIDEYGNFANPTEGREGGPGFRTNYAVIRGDGEGQDGYDFLAISDELAGIADKYSGTPKYGYKYKMTTDARDPDHLFITLERDTGSGYQIIIDQFDAKDAQYNQSTTPDYVRFAFTSGTGGGCNRHEIDELSVRGYCQPYDPNPPSTVENNSDIVNNFTTDGTYNTGTKYITTKVAGKTESLTGVHLDDASNAVPFSSRDNLTFKIIPYLSNSDCTTRAVLKDINGNPAVITVTNGNTVGSIDVVMPKTATKDSRISLSALDLQQVYTNSNQQCLKTSATTGNLQGIEECANSEPKYLLTFGEETWQRCYIDNGEPCKSNNHGVGDAPYNNSYGCLMCTLDTSSTCSSDNFAIRPDGFSLTSTSNDFPDLLRASQDYALTLKAFNFNNPMNVNDLTTNYTITDAQNIITFNTILNAADGTPDANLAGTTSWSDVTDFDIINGLSTDGGTNEVASIKFNNVGKVNISVVDALWANVDLTDERGMKDPSNTLHNNCDADGAYICGSVDTTFIPHHFTLVNSSITNNNANPGNFTYISTLTPGTVATYAMAARVTTQIESRNKDENVTTNFKTGSYENPLNVQLVVNDGDNGVANPTEIGDGTTTGDILLNFTDGRYKVPWDEADSTKMLRFNFVRTNNTPMNPFQVMPDEIDIVVDSIYTAAGTPSSPATITIDTSGDGATAGNINNSATFIYGRTHAPRQRIEGDEGNAFIYYEAYCSGVDANGVNCTQALLPNGAASTTIDDPRWFTNTLHTTAAEGTPGLVIQKGATNIDNVTPTGYPTSTMLLKYNKSKGFPYKTTLQNSASSWLIYDKYDALGAKTTNEFEVEFTDSTSTWAGQQETDNATNRNASDRTNRRSMW